MSASKKITHRSTRKSKYQSYKIILFCVSVVALVVSGVLLRQFLSTAKKATDASFQLAYDETKQNTYDQFKQKAFDYYEKKNHVSNRGTLTISNIKEENALEVLSVSDSWVKISDPDTDAEKTTRWVEFSATGVYTVDMTVSEFIIDEYHNLIYVELKTPQLNHIALNTETKAYLYKYEKGFTEVNGDYDSGVKELLNDREEALNHLTEQLENNDENLVVAKKSAEELIRTFLKNVNPDMNLKDSDIQIKFI